MKKSLSLLIKPASGSCNMRCKYCFYHDLAKVKAHASFGMMSEQVMETIVKKAYDYADGFITFGFQGGEPTLRGLDFFKTFVDLAKKHNKNNVETLYTLQTNGYAIDKNWAKFLAEKHFLVGLSMDGTKDIHDLNRIDAEGKGTYKNTLKTAQLFNRYKVEYNILCVVTKAVARHGAKVYNALKNAGYKFIQFILCLDSLERAPGSANYSLTPKDYGNFLKIVCDIWYKDMLKGDYTSIRMFDNIMGMLKGYPPESCDLQGSCSVGTVFEADGSMYPCDFYVMDEWKLGNICDDGFEEMLNSTKAREFVSSSLNIAKECLSCEFKAICRGGCRRHKEPTKEGQQLENYFCEAYKIFYDESLEKLRHLARILN